MAKRTLFIFGWRYLWRHPWQSLLMIVGIMLGVAVAVSVDLANSSASRAFDLSTETVAGRATHQITSGPAGIDETEYVRLRSANLQAAFAPVISDYVKSPQLGGQTLQLLGIDPFAEAPFRSYLGSESGKGRISVKDLSIFLTRPGAILISEQLAERYGLSQGQSLTLEIVGRPKTVFIAGLLQPLDGLSRRALSGLILADIATAQELMERAGKLDRIDVLLPEGAQGDLVARQIASLIPKDDRLQPVAARSGAVTQMTAAFRLNLSALSLLALVVGMFLIYNTITFSVVQRRPLFGTLRCLGVTRGQVFIAVIVEAALVGILGSALGMLIGVFMGQGAVRLVTQTINDLFFVLNVRGVQIPIGSVAKGGVLGVTATLLSAAPPAWEAAGVPPRAALSRSGLESKAQRAISLAAGVGAGLIALGVIILLLPSRSLVLGFGGTFSVIIGFAMLVPLVTRISMHTVIPGLSRLWGTLGRMAPRDVESSLSRTSIAVMALMLAVSVTIGVSLMVDSFRFTVVTWLAETLHGDIYISAPSFTATTPSTSIDPQVIETVRSWPGVARVDILRSATVDTPQGWIQVAATNNLTVADERIYLATDVPHDQIWEKLMEGNILVSEPLANRLGMPKHGGTLTMNTSKGSRQFSVIGIYYDYSSPQGTALMALPIYQQLWDDPEITAIQLRLMPGVQADKLVMELQDALAPFQEVLVRANRSLRQEVLAVFDRTFAITGALQLLATVVAFVGILSALLSLELEKQRELGILRSIGMTVRQVRSLILLETGLMGMVAGLLAMPTGYILALILIYIINKRSFGWTIQMQVSRAPFIEALLVALTAALIAGIYPAVRMGRIVASEALRSE